MSTRTPRHPGIDCDHLGDYPCARCAAAWEAAEWMAASVAQFMEGIGIRTNVTVTAEGTLGMTTSVADVVAKLVAFEERSRR